jgi:chromatin remodeling complex protein RSC6
MSTEIETVVDASKIDSSVDQLETVLSSLVSQASVVKGLINTVRAVIKDSQKKEKELEKLRNKRSRNKTERSATSLPSGITKPVAISDELAKFLGVEIGTLVPRNEVTKGVSGFVKSNGLSDPANKQRFVLDDREPAKKLRVLLGNPGEDVTYFNLQRYLKHHYLPMAPSEPTPKTPKAPKAAAVTPVLPPEPVAEPVKKKILVKKVKTQLSEEA